MLTRKDIILHFTQILILALIFTLCLYPYGMAVSFITNAIIFTTGLNYYLALAIPLVTAVTITLGIFCPPEKGGAVSTGTGVFAIISTLFIIVCGIHFITS